ncbi:hypothetical protein SERLADRAFT_433368 [Serpula lacrymans var. lacrymans S7.9]|uniref:Uncharacterized protein n=1 Tax=Serpula lacrymans var. lacrymans (strain S7.9) TaxID=578457 RepID=F8NGJ4_SERL9|nr:uncharacterized protein SERLADRAFT_433368 [Serpula lacrymans var. lacrymans S7.9]EGO29381.1 hypothetical protein SERLADRAFT_433368 [Serpula lacrymans var. lacrymans S7.9]
MSSTEWSNWNASTPGNSQGECFAINSTGSVGEPGSAVREVAGIAGVDRRYVASPVRVVFQASSHRDNHDWRGRTQYIKGDVRKYLSLLPSRQEHPPPTSQANAEVLELKFEGINSPEAFRLLLPLRNYTSADNGLATYVPPTVTETAGGENKRRKVKNQTPMNPLSRAPTNGEPQWWEMVVRKWKFDHDTGHLGHSP